MQYDTLVQLISENPILMDTVRDLLETDRDEILNLVQPDWQDRLHNDSLFQKYRDGKVTFSKDVPYKYIKLQPIANKAKDTMKILVAGYFAFYKTIQNNRIKYYFVPKECPPLIEIGRAFIPKVSDYAPRGKFSVESCGYASCRDCPKLAELFKVPIDCKNQWWCVRNTKIFNGDSVKNAFRQTIVRDFEDKVFMAILTVHIDTRQYYGDKFNMVKMIGTVKNMIIFQENAFQSRSNKEYEIFVDPRISDTASATVTSSHGRKEDEKKEETDPFLLSLKNSSSSNHVIKFTPNEYFNDMECETNEGEDDTDIKCIPTFHQNNPEDDDENEFVVEKADQFQFD